MDSSQQSTGMTSFLSSSRIVIEDPEILTVAGHSANRCPLLFVKRRVRKGRTSVLHDRSNPLSLPFCLKGEDENVPAALLGRPESLAASRVTSKHALRRSRLILLRRNRDWKVLTLVTKIAQK
jgi:hypothetical protein